MYFVLHNWKIIGLLARSTEGQLSNTSWKVLHSMRQMQGLGHGALQKMFQMYCVCVCVCVRTHAWGCTHTHMHVSTLVLERLETWAVSRLEYWAGLPFPSPEDLPNPGIQLSLLSKPPGKPVLVLLKISITWELRNAHHQTPPQIHWIRNAGVGSGNLWFSKSQVFLMKFDTHWSELIEF